MEKDGYLEEIKKMEVHENSQTVFGLKGNHQTHRLVLKTKQDRKLIIPDKLRSGIVT